jgi:hypothetical protein
MSPCPMVHEVTLTKEVCHFLMEKKKIIIREKKKKIAAEDSRILV